MHKNVSLVLSGGGARGNAHIGVIEELLTRNYSITSLAGTSMGALVGGTFATGKLQEFKEWMCSLDKFKVFQLIDFTLSNQGLIKGDRVLNTIRQFVGEQCIEELPIPFSIIASDVLKKEEVVFNTGSMFDAIRASIAIPTVITPVKKDGRILVDGGVVNNLPVNRVKRSPNDLLIAVNVNADIPLQLAPSTQEELEQKQKAYQIKVGQFEWNLNRRFPDKKKQDFNYFDLMNLTIQFMMRHNEEMMLETYKPDVMIDISQETCGMFDFFKAADTIEQGRYIAKLCLDKYEQSILKNDENKVLVNALDTDIKNRT